MWNFAQLLVEHGADVNAQDVRKSIPALIRRHVEFAWKLLEHGADVNSQDDGKSTPLHLTSMGGHIKFARELVEHGANWLGRTLFEEASRGFHDISAATFSA